MAELVHDIHGSGPLLLLIHGITENRHSWDPILDRLAATHRVLRVDLRGHGESPLTDSYDLADMADDIAALVDETPLVVGHSLGGTVATAYAARHQVRGTVNIDQTLNLVPMQAGLQAQAELLRSEHYPLFMDALFESLRGQVDADGWQRLSELRRYDQDVILGVWGILLDTTPAELDEVVTAVTTGITTPYLELNGFDLGPDYPEWLRARIPGAVVETWDGVGHYPQLVRPEEFLARLAAFEATLS